MGEKRVNLLELNKLNKEKPERRRYNFVLLFVSYMLSVNQLLIYKLVYKQFKII